MTAIQRRLYDTRDDQILGAGGATGASHAPVDLSALLASGGDRRIQLDPVTARNRYGTRTTPAESELCFSSTTASNISMEGFQAAERALARLLDGATPGAAGMAEWFGDIRGQIGRVLGCDGAEVVLAASGTDVELIVIGLMAGLSARPITNILIAPDETGSGIPMAAAGRHYSDLAALGAGVTTASTLAGMSPDSIDVRTIAIRDATGAPRSADDVDAELVAAVAEELKRDRDVLVHVLDTSKTGLSGVTRQAAREAVALAADRVRVVVDACQFRCSASQLHQDIADGFLVAITGSKFIAGPPFAGAILIPAALATEIANNGSLPAGLCDYTAAQDWPTLLRDRLRLPFPSDVNLGLGLRWVAALENLTRCAAIDDGRQRLIKTRFVDMVRSRVEAIRSLSIHPLDDGAHLNSTTIVPLTVTTGAGAFATFEAARDLQILMRSPAEGPVCHIGQAVNLGSRAVLRVAASAIDVASVAEGMASGLSLEQAFAPVEAKLDIVFHKWAAVLHSA